MRNADLDDLKDEQYAEQVKQERKEVDAMPKTQTTPILGRRQPSPVPPVADRRGNRARSTS